VHAHLRWSHPVRGEIAAGEFLPLAEATGLATRLSTWALARFGRDKTALRAHAASDELLCDLTQLFEKDILAPAELELRFSEKAIAGLAQPGPTLRALADLGIGIVIDEFGRGSTSLPQLPWQLPRRSTSSRCRPGWTTNRSVGSWSLSDVPRAWAPPLPTAS
jgi:EAL domain-containing protein (putative c-di-GMP-specific phosphodiesterase class I)